MKKQYRIRVEHDELDGVKSSTIYIPEYRSIWTLFIWTRLSIYAVYGTRLEAEVAIKIHRGDMKTITTYEDFE